MNESAHSHLSAEQLQAFLEGEMPSRALAEAEEHLASCVRCSTELEAWRVLFEDLGGLSGHGPPSGFGDRVMSRVDVPEGSWQGHVPPHVLQDFLDGSVAARRAEEIQGHLDSCRTCAAESDAWLAVMQRLDDVQRMAPRDGFAERVMAEVRVARPATLLSRLGERLRSWIGNEAPEHVPAGLLQDYLDGALPVTAVARVDSHVESCGSCADELAAWRRVAVRLDGLERLEPEPGFADAVLARYRVARAARRAVAPAPAWRRLLAAAASWMPSSRRVWAALSGIAVTPAVTAGLIAWAVFSHPTMTLGSLVSFVWWQVADLSGIVLARLAGGVTQNAEVFGLFSLLDELAAAPVMVVGGVFAYSMICALALRVLYRNVFSNRPSGNRHAHVSTAS